MRLLLGGKDGSERLLASLDAFVDQEVKALRDRATASQGLLERNDRVGLALLVAMLGVLEQDRLHVDLPVSSLDPPGDDLRLGVRDRDLDTVWCQARRTDCVAVAC